jgi:hypothetical protein
MFLGLVPLVWAQQKLSFLNVFPEKNKDAIVELGRKFQFVTPGTSLLVLETLAQHLEHKIEPHPSRKKLAAEYHAALKAKAKVKSFLLKSKKNEYSFCLASFELKVSFPPSLSFSFSLSLLYQSEEKDIDQKLERVKGWWQQRIDWWKRDFKYELKEKQMKKV